MQLLYKNIPYKIHQSKKAKYIGIRVSPKNEIILILPEKASVKKGLSFLEEKYEWILQKQKKAQKISIKKELELLFVGDFIPYTKEFVHKKKGWHSLQNGILFFYIPILKKECKKTENTLIENFYKSEAQKYINVKAEKFAYFLSVKFHKISLKKQNSRWGSCSSKGNLNFNYMIMTQKPEIIDYLIAHEICHLKEMNHSLNFWKLVESVIPNYKTHSKYLKQLSPQMFL